MEMKYKVSIKEKQLDNNIKGKLNKTQIVNNLTTEETGYALDASQGKILNDKIELLMQEIEALKNNTNN